MVLKRLEKIDSGRNIAYQQTAKNDRGRLDPPQNCLWVVSTDVLGLTQQVDRKVESYIKWWGFCIHVLFVCFLLDLLILASTRTSTGISLKIRYRLPVPSDSVVRSYSYPHSSKPILHFNCSDEWHQYTHFDHRSIHNQ